METRTPEAGARIAATHRMRLGFISRPRTEHIGAIDPRSHLSCSASSLGSSASTNDDRTGRGSYRRPWMPTNDYLRGWGGCSVVGASRYTRPFIIRNADRPAYTVTLDDRAICKRSATFAKTRGDSLTVWSRGTGSVDFIRIAKRREPLERCFYEPSSGQFEKWLFAAAYCLFLRGGLDSACISGMRRRFLANLDGHNYVRISCMHPCNCRREWKLAMHCHGSRHGSLQFHGHMVCQRGND
jgi:hypothetical protein